MVKPTKIVIEQVTNLGLGYYTPNAAHLASMIDTRGTSALVIGVLDNNTYVGYYPIEEAVALATKLQRMRKVKFDMVTVLNPAVTGVMAKAPAKSTGAAKRAAMSPSERRAATKAAQAKGVASIPKGQKHANGLVPKYDIKNLPAPKPAPKRMKAKGGVHQRHDGTYVVTTLWSGVPVGVESLDRGSISFGKNKSLAHRVAKAMTDGVWFSDPMICTDIYGQRYVNATGLSMGKYANSALNKIGR